jgi:hypothetical protein
MIYLGQNHCARFLKKHPDDIDAISDELCLPVQNIQESIRCTKSIKCMKLRRFQKMKKVLLILVGIIFILSSFLYFGCSSESDQKNRINRNSSLNESIMEKHKRDMQNKQHTQGTETPDDEGKMMRKNQRDSAEACQKEFEKCIEHGSGEGNEDFCLKMLSACEKNLPGDLQTLKKE